jgi:hypothetical protein
MQRQAAALAERVEGEAGHDPTFQVRHAYQLALARDPTGREIELALQLMRRQSASFESLLRRITFRPDVSESIYNAYQDKLGAEDHLVGPRESWTYYRGDWSKDYEGIRTVNRVRGPFALWKGVEFTDGVVEAKLTLQGAAEFASLLFRASATNGVQRGYELALDARQQKILLRRHGMNVTTLTQASTPIQVGSPIRVRIEARGDEVSVWLDGQEKPSLELKDVAPIAQPGQIGVRAWGAAVNVDKLMVSTGTGTLDVLANRDAKTPSHCALQALCLTLLNLNELVYVD